MRLGSGKNFGKHRGLNKNQLLSHQANIQTRFDVVGPAVPVLEIVGVFPDVDPVDGGAAGHQGGVLIGEGFDEKFSVFAAAEPSPTASEDAHRAFSHFFLPLYITAKGIIDLLGQLALRLLSRVGERFPKDGVVRVTPGIVADGGADFGGNGI